MLDSPDILGHCQDPAYRGGPGGRQTVIEEHIARFERFVDGFQTGLEGDDGHIRLKKEHSLHVLAEAQAIVPTLDMTSDQARAALLAALYHDAGRFPQYRAYKTFKDSSSCNHAFLGVRAVRAEGLLARESPRVRGLALGAVVMHNRRTLPRGIPQELALVAGMLRDCDKLDIIRIMLEHLRPGGKRSEVVVLHLADEPRRCSPEVLAQVASGRIGEYASMRYENDFKLLLLSWAHDLNTRAARRAFLERGHVRELFGLLPQSPELTQLHDTIYKVLDQ